MIFTYQHNDQTHTIQLDAQNDGSYLATIGEQTIHVKSTPLSDGCLLLEWDGGRTIIYTAANENERFVHVNGQTLNFTVPDARSSRRRAAAGGGDLTAQMPGQVVDVLVNDGDSVKAGQTLVVLEAMKMEIRVTAPADGTIKRVLVKTGDTVDRGQNLIEIEP